MSKMPNNLTIFAFNTRNGILSPSVDHVLEMYLHFCCMPSFVSLSVVVPPHIHAQLDYVHKEWIYLQFGIYLPYLTVYECHCFMYVSCVMKLIM